MESEINDIYGPINRSKYRNILMATLLFAMCIAMQILYGMWADTMCGEGVDLWDAVRHKTTNFKSMEVLSGAEITVILAAGYRLFRKNRYSGWYCLFWLVLFCIADYAISLQFPIYNFQHSTAVTRDINRDVSPFLVVMCGLGYALPFTWSWHKCSKMRNKSHYLRIIFRLLWMTGGAVASIVMNMIIYIIGVLCGLVR